MRTMKKLRQELPGNPRYQPVSLIPFFGYDNTARFLIEVEWALLEALADIEIIPKKESRLLTDRLKQKLIKKITMTLIDEREKKVTKHDIRALVQLMQESMPKSLRKWVHFSATSYDIIENARIIAYKKAFREVTFPAMINLIENLYSKTKEFSSELQIGRTHGQHALPITVGFWMATILSRFLDVAKEIKEAEGKLVGKFSGAVGAYNAQVALRLDSLSQERFDMTFEELVLSKIGLKPSAISTQILPMNHLARFLHEHVLFSGNLAQFGRDCRHLQRSEISEIAEAFDSSQVGSSTMAHKRNPITFENTEGIFEIVSIEYQKVFRCLISEHQRDLVGSSIMREFPGIVVLTQYQIERIGKVLPKITVDKKALNRNFDMSEKMIMSELLYLTLQLYGYKGDAHELVNHTLVPRVKRSNLSLVNELVNLAQEEDEIADILSKIPKELLDLLSDPQMYTGKAEIKTKEILEQAEIFIKECKSNKDNK